jgi:hypothetical protein
MEIDEAEAVPKKRLNTGGKSNGREQLQNHQSPKNASPTGITGDSPDPLPPKEHKPWTIVDS